MSNSNIKDYIASNSVFLIKKIWFPIVGTLVFSFMLINDYIEAVYGNYELVSLTLFRLIYICGFWIMYFSDIEFSKLNDAIKNSKEYNQCSFDEIQEHAFQKKLEKLGRNVGLLIVILLLFEGFRFLTDLISMNSLVEIAVFVCLLISSIALFLLSALAHKRLVFFLKAVVNEKTTVSFDI